MKPSMRRARSRGFTLIEVILVVLIFGIMAAMAYGGLNSVLKTRVSIEASMKRTADLQKAYMRMRSDFQNYVPRPIRDNFGDVQPSIRGAREQVVELTRGGWRNPLFLKRSSMERVSYALDGDKLQRISYRVLDRAQDSEPVRTVLLDQVKELRLRYMDKEREWVDQWPQQQLQQQSGENPARQDPPPPLAIELTLVTADLGELRFLFKPGAEPMPANMNLQGQPPPPPAGNNSSGDEGSGGSGGSGNGGDTGEGNGSE
ncbi:type II secretion system minor pseudopilin GspJ [Hydrocarboniphaga effusa]|uniref:type II secretion system minor pseudopilin GspJ n=1 Tax=Hydrocarboniphaga effusa TaxID=243629 RepID=UPI00398BF35A